MDEHKIILSATTPDGLDASKTIAVNPDASNELLKTFGQMLNNMTNNTYGKTDRIITINCDTEDGGGKQTPTLYVMNAAGDPIAGGDRTTDANTFVSYSIFYDGDGEIIVEAQGTGTFLTNIGSFDQTTHRAPFTFYLKATAAQQYSDLTIYATETDNFKATQTATIRFIAVNI